MFIPSCQDFPFCPTIIHHITLKNSELIIKIVLNIKYVHFRKKNATKCSEKFATSRWWTWPTMLQLRFARNPSSKTVHLSKENPFARRVNRVVIFKFLKLKTIICETSVLAFGIIIIEVFLTAF